MKPRMKIGLSTALFASILFFVIQNGCRVKPKPCCIPVTPTYSVTDSGLIVQPPVFSDLTGSVLTVINLTDSTVILLDTIEPGGNRLVPVDLDSTSINVHLDYLTSGPVTDIPKYCPGSDNFTPVRTLIVMDVVLQRNNHDQACTPPGCGTIATKNGQSGSTVVSAQPGRNKFIEVNGIRLYFEVMNGNSMKAYYCNPDLAISNTDPDKLQVTAANGDTFLIEVSPNSTSGFDFTIYFQTQTGNWTVGECSP